MSASRKSSLSSVATVMEPMNFIRFAIARFISSNATYKAGKGLEGSLLR